MPKPACPLKAARNVSMQPGRNSRLATLWRQQRRIRTDRTTTLADFCAAVVILSWQPNQQGNLEGCISIHECDMGPAL